MACQVEQIADCGDISTLARALFIQDKEDENWLTQCSVSVTSCGNVLAVAHKTRLCVLTAQWISSTDSNTYLISWNGTLPAEISAILALSICPSHNSSQNGPDWFCIMVGFTNGSIGFYTNTGHLLLMERLDEKPVLKITCHTGTYGTLPDDISVLYESCVCIISGVNLFQTLRQAKAQIARVQAGALEDYAVDGRSINVRKWTFTEHETLTDACVVGLEVKNTYDHLLSASTYGGYDTWYRSIPPANSLVVGVGSRPFVSWQYALEGGTAPPLQDVARAVAHKIKSALPGWLGGGSAPPTGTPEPQIRGTALSLRCGVTDGTGRAARAAALCPSRRLVAIPDALGRVTVLDTATGRFVRMFKGCRDAQCAFVQVFEQDSKKPKLSSIKENQRALFLIIYNPKKGIIDIRLMRRGNRVAVFTATKNGRLIYNTCGLVGAEPNYTHKKLNLPEHQCILIDPDGKIKRFIIPFFFALEGEHSDRSKDLHILREMRDYLKRMPRNEYDDEDILKQAADLKTIDLKKHCVEMLIRNYQVHPRLVIACLNMFIGTLDKSANSKQVKNYFQKLVLVTAFYYKINNDSSECLDALAAQVREELGIVFEVEEEVKEEKELDFSLLVDDDCIMERLLLLAQERDYREQQHARVTFSDTQTHNYKDFVTSFDLETSDPHLTIKPDSSQDKLNSISSYIFKAVMKMNRISDLSDLIRNCNMDAKELIQLFIQHIMNTSLEDISVELIQKFIEVLYYVCLSSKEACEMRYNEVSSWWEGVRDSLAAARCPLRSMLLGMACKAVGTLLDQTHADDDAWESVTTENAKWGILIGRLEDISILSIILHLKETYNGTEFPHDGARFPKLVAIDYDVNLKLIYTKGKGSVTELISKWLCSMGVPPAAVVANDLQDKFSSDAAVEATEESDDINVVFLENHKDLVENNMKIFKWVSLLRQQFPFSTSSDYIIVNMCWEYALDWQKNVQDIDKLEAAMKCFRYISNTRIRVGLCALVWSTYVKPTFEHACRLINKVGKLPKEPLCLQDVGMSDTKLVKFLEISTVFLEQFYNSSIRELEEKKRMPFEKIWDTSSQSLMEVAQDCCDVNKDTLSLTYQMCCVMYYQCSFNFKMSKPLTSLFDVDFQNVLESLCNEVSCGGGERLKAARVKFLGKAMSAAVETITGDGRDVPYDMSQFTSWMERAQQLAEYWTMDQDLINEQQTIALFHAGIDEFALYSAASLSVSAASRALPAASVVMLKRMRAALPEGERLAELLAAFPPALPRLIETVDAGLTSGSLSGALSVLSAILDRLHETPAPHKHHAELLLQGCRMLISMEGHDK